MNGLRLTRPRTSTLVLLAVFLVALVTYFLVRPPASGQAGEDTVDPAPVTTPQVQEPSPSPVPSPVPEPEPTPTPAPPPEDAPPSPTAEPGAEPTAELPQGPADGSGPGATPEA